MNRLKNCVNHFTHSTYASLKWSLKMWCSCFQPIKLFKKKTPTTQFHTFSLETLRRCAATARLTCACSWPLAPEDVPTFFNFPGVILWTCHHQSSIHHSWMWNEPTETVSKTNRRPSMSCFTTTQRQTVKIVVFELHNPESKTGRSRTQREARLRDPTKTFYLTPQTLFTEFQKNNTRCQKKMKKKNEEDS